jgi:predicted dehydrogenase
VSKAVAGVSAPAPRSGSVDDVTAAHPMYRGALIGFGGVARNSHLPGTRQDPQLRNRLAFVVAVDPAPDARSGAEIPVIADRQALESFAPIDFVDVCTPTGQHLATTLWALEQGLHVLCEKPVATTRAESNAIAAAARQAGRVVMPCHQHRFNPAWQQMQRWLHDGAIGRWHLAELSVYRPAADAGRGDPARPWRTVAAEGAGGILLDHGTHLLYSLLDAAGAMPTAVRAWTGRLLHREYGVEDTAQVILEFPDRLATMMLTWAAPHRENRVRFIGDRGTIDWQGGVLTLERAPHQRETLDFSAQLDKRSYAGWFAALFGTFADALDRGTAPEALDEIDRVARVLEAAYDAAATGSRITLD